MSSHEIFENMVATFVDIGSIMVAYTVGIHQSNFLVGISYAILDAILVVWMRKPLSNLIRSALQIRGGRSAMRDVYLADIS
jgi:hypothetical protein